MWQAWDFSAACTEFLIDLTLGEDVLYSRLSSKSCRYSIRRAEKLGVTIEEASDEGFADEYYEQLLDVFAKQSLVPTYDRERVRLLIRHLAPTGNLLLLRAREPQGRCIATGIFVGLHQFAYFWGNASCARTSIFAPTKPCNGTPSAIGNGAERSTTIWAVESTSGNTAGC